MNDSKLRILYVIPTLDQSGAEKQLALLASGLPTRQFQSEVIALNRGGYYEQILQDSQIPFQSLGKRLRIDPVTHFRLKQQISRFQPDIVHSWLFAANTHCRLLKKRSSTWKSVVAERCVDSWKASWQKFCDRRLISHTDAMVVNSQSVARFYRELGVPESLIHVINNGIANINSGLDSTETTRSAVRDQWGIPQDAFVVLSVGRLAPQKRLNTLLWAMHMLSLAEKNVYAVFAGEGPDRAELLELVKKYEITDRVLFTGHVNDAGPILKAADAFWLGSSFEGQSNSLMEAMAAGLPVAVSDIPANLELVEHEQTGLVAAMGDSASFASAIRRLIREPEFAAQLGNTAAQKMADEYSIDQMISKHVELYQRITGNSES